MTPEKANANFQPRAKKQLKGELHDAKPVDVFLKFKDIVAQPTHHTVKSIYSVHAQKKQASESGKGVISQSYLFDMYLF